MLRGSIYNQLITMGHHLVEYRSSSWLSEILIKKSMKNNTFGCHVDGGRGPRSLSTAYLSRVDPPPIHRAAGFLKFWLKKSMKNNTFGCHVDGPHPPGSWLSEILIKKKYEKQYLWLSRRPGEGPALLKYGVLKQGGPPAPSTGQLAFWNFD